MIIIFFGKQSIYLNIYLYLISTDVDLHLYFNCIFLLNHLGEIVA